ncbi:sensor histidine kinase [Spirosoma aerophilum]
MLPDLSSNRLTKLLFEQSEDFIGLYDVDTEQFARVNKAGARMLGFATEAEFIANVTWSKSIFLNPYSDDPQSTLISQVREKGRYEQEVQRQQQDGTPFWSRLVITALADEGSADTSDYFLVHLTNQGRLHQAEQELKQSVQRYEAVFNHATIGIIVADQRGRIVSINQMTRQLFGYPGNELIGQPIDILVPTNVSKYHERLRQSFAANPQVREMGHNRDLKARRKDGSVFPTEISLSYFQLDEEFYAVSYIIDITFKKEAERELIAHRDRIEGLNTALEQKVADRTHALMNTLDQLEQSKDELAKALEAERELGELKSRFVEMASHEFRTPLTTVLTSATLIEKYTDNDQQEKRAKHLQRIRSSVKHLNDILEEFLSVGKLEEGKIAARPVLVDLPQLIRDVVAEINSVLKAGQVIELQINCVERVWLDPSLLRKVLVNLLTNASKYSDENSEISVQCDCADRGIHVSVADHGIGISAEDQEHLFERFFRAQNAINKPGTGLGLHIVARYIELMGGTVDLRSELNKGTTVTLLLPYEKHTAD